MYVDTQQITKFQFHGQQLYLATNCICPIGW